MLILLVFNQLSQIKSDQVVIIFNIRERYIKMSGKIIKLNPEVSPLSYYNQNPEELGVVPDGTGLQIIFKVNGENFLIAGPRNGKVLTVNGGAIEDKEAPFLTQLSEELMEETFGTMNVVRTHEGYQLLLRDGSRHALSMQENQSFQSHKPGVYAYITFTAVCDSLTLVQLNEIALSMTPTASFWNKIGNYLFPHTRNAPKDETFAQYWQSNFEARNALITTLVNEYNQYLDASVNLLIDPKDVFQADTIEQSLNKLHAIADFAALNKMFRHTVGRYSERSGYHVFNAFELLNAATQEQCDVHNINGAKVATGVFNEEAVAQVFPALNIEASKKQTTSSGVAQMGIFVAPKIVVAGNNQTSSLQNF